MQSTGQGKQTIRTSKTYSRAWKNLSRAELEIVKMKAEAIIEVCKPRNSVSDL